MGGDHAEENALLRNTYLVGRSDCLTWVRQEPWEPSKQE